MVAGVDIGSVASKAVVFDGERICGWAVVPTGWSPKQAGEEALTQAMAMAGISRERLEYVVGTGYGRALLDFAQRKVTEITCHGRGVHHLYPKAKTVVDIGGQDSKIIRMDDSGSVTDFLMNDKCAAGTGRFLQTLAGVLEIEVDDIGNLADGHDPLPINSMCTVFAESEIVGLLAQGQDKARIAAGILQSIARRISGMAGRTGVEKDVVFTGGTAKNHAMAQEISRELQTQVIVPEQPQIIGALGAAVIAWDTLQKEAR